MMALKNLSYCKKIHKAKSKYIKKFHLGKLNSERNTEQSIEFEQKDDGYMTGVWLMCDSYIDDVFVKKNIIENQTKKTE